MKEKYLKKVFKLDEDSLLCKYLKDNFKNFTLAGYIEYLAKYDGDILALCHVDKDNNKTEFTYKDLNLKANKMANYLKNKGIKKGDVVALVLRNNYEFFIAVLALQKLGAVTMPLFYTNKKDQYKSIFERSNVKCVIAEDYEIKQSKDTSSYVLDEIDNACKDSVIKICNHPKSNYSNSWNNLGYYEKESNVFKSEKVKITDLGYLFATSGTTGEPKLVMHNYGFSLAHYFTGLWYGVKKGNKHLTICDSGWAMSSWSMPGVFLHQGTIYVNDFDRFDEEKILNAIKEENIKSLCAPRTMLKKFTNYLEKNDNNMEGQLESIASAGEPLSDDDKELVKSFFGIYLKEGYGMTEVALPLYEDGSGKKVISPLYSNVRIDKKNNEKVGEIIVEGGKLGLLMGYLDKKKKYVLYRKPPIKKGKVIWHTSDMGHIDEKGNIICDGRYGCIVKINDCLVNKNDVEKIIKTHPLVSDCVVESKKDDVSGNILIAKVELKDPNSVITKEEIKMYVKSKLQDYCRPKNVEFTILPRSNSGKVIKEYEEPVPDKCLVVKK